MPIDTRQTKDEGYYGAYGRKKAQRAATGATYTTDGGTRTYDTATGKLLGKQDSPGYVSTEDYLNQQSKNAGISASTMPQNEISRVNSRNDALSNLNGGTDRNTDNTPISTSGEISQIVGAMNTANKDYQSMYKSMVSEGHDMINRIYDTALARNDLGYKNMMEDIKRDQDKAIQVATSNAIALNPYSQSRGSQTAANFNNAINQEYTRQAQRATELYQQANRELADGNAKAAMELKQAAKQELAQTNQRFQAQLMDLYKESQDQQRFEIQQKSKTQDDFFERISALGEDAKAEDFQSLFEMGRDIGLDDKEIEFFVKTAANMAGAEAKDAEINREYKEALTASAWRSANQPYSSSGKDEDVPGVDFMYGDKDLPGDLRRSILDDFSNQDYAKQYGELELEDLVRMYPEVQVETLRKLKNDFYDYDSFSDEEGESGGLKQWWQNLFK